MAHKGKYKSEALEALHATVADLHEIGVFDKATMRHFDASCLTPVPEFKPAQLKKMRESNKLSQPVMAAFLSVSPSTFKKWESGEKKPSGAALKLLDVVRKHGLEVLA